MSECKQAQSHEQQIAELKDSRLPKTEREHAAVREIERLEQRLAEADAKPRWIPVSERLPDDYVNVLGRDLGDGSLSVCYRDSRGIFCAVGFDIPAFENDGSWASAATRITGRISHWMQLPDAPEGE